MLPHSLSFSSVKRRKIEASFAGGEISSDAGLLLLKEVDNNIGLTRSVAKQLVEHRCLPQRCTHKLKTLLLQRVFGIASGYEDLNDHKTLRLQSIVGQIDDIASPSTLCRFDNAQRQTANKAVHQALFNQFIGSYKTPPKEIILDFDATDAPLFGDQEGKHFNGYYGHYCYLPLYVFAGDHLLCAYLQTADKDPARHALVVLKRLVKGIRAKWPKTNIIYRGDTGFYKPKILDWCEANDVAYITGFTATSVLNKKVKTLMDSAENIVDKTGVKVKEFYQFQYQASSWQKERKMVCKLECTEKGRNQRFIVTNLDSKKADLYCKDYCGRGDMENRIKDQLHLFSARMSAHERQTNQWRMLLSGLAYTLFVVLKKHVEGTEFEGKLVETLRLKLMKIGAVIVRNTRKIKIMMNSNYPWQKDWWTILAKIKGS
jgi:hypothetical protein